jgi:predicted DNA-binding transcriptional regulator
MHQVFNQNLTEVSDGDLHQRHGELLKKITQANRLGYVGAVQQMQMILMSFNDEIIRRNQEKLEKMLKKDNDLDQYINIG